MAPPRTAVTASSCSLLFIYRPRKDERLSWPSWLTYIGRFTHTSGHPSAVGRAQHGESSLVKDRRSTAEPRNQPKMGLGFRSSGSSRRQITRMPCPWLKIVALPLREFPTPLSGGLIPPNFRTTPPASGERRERGEGEGGGKGMGEEKGREGRGPQGLVDNPHVPNPEKYPAATDSTFSSA